MSSEEAGVPAPEASESQASGSPSPEPTPSDVANKELRQKVTQQGETIKTAEQMVSYLRENHPDALKSTVAHLSGETNGNYGEEVAEILGVFDDPKAQEALSRLEKVIRRQVKSELSPQLRAAQSVAQSAAEERGLRAAGVDLHDGEFSTLRPQLEDQRYQNLLRSYPEDAAQYLGERFLARRGSASNGSTRTTAREAAAATTSTGTRGAGDSETFEVTKDMDIHEIYKQISAGKKAQ